MKMPLAVETNMPGGRVLIDAGSVIKVEHNWLGGGAVRLNFGDGGFVVVPAAEATKLERSGVIPPK